MYSTQRRSLLCTIVSIMNIFTPAESLSIYCGYKTFVRSLVLIETINLCCHQRDEGKLLVLRHCDVLVGTCHHGELF